MDASTFSSSDINFDTISPFPLEDLGWLDALSSQDVRGTAVSSPAQHGWADIFSTDADAIHGDEDVNLWDAMLDRLAEHTDGQLDDDSDCSWNEGLATDDDELASTWTDIRELLSNRDRLTAVSSPLSLRRRRKVHETARRLGLVHATIGSGREKHVLLSKCALAQPVESLSVKHTRCLDTPRLANGIVDASILKIHSFAQTSSQEGPNYYLEPTPHSQSSRTTQVPEQNRGVRHTYQRSFREGPSITFSITNVFCALSLPLPNRIVVVPHSPSELYLLFPTALEAAKVFVEFRKPQHSTNLQNAAALDGYARFINPATCSAFKDGSGDPPYLSRSLPSHEQNTISQQGLENHDFPLTPRSHTTSASLSPHPADPPLDTSSKRKRPSDLRETMTSCSSNGCNKAFRTPGECRKHEKIHKKRTHFCNLCGDGRSAGFLYPKDLKRHRKNVHKLEE